MALCYASTGGMHIRFYGGVKVFHETVGKNTFKIHIG